VPLTPEIPRVSSPDNIEGIVALSEAQLVVVKFADEALYRIGLREPITAVVTIAERGGAVRQQSHRSRSRPAEGPDPTDARLETAPLRPGDL
jgi:hypothetical protein